MKAVWASSTRTIQLSSKNTMSVLLVQHSTLHSAVQRPKRNKKVQQRSTAQYRHKHEGGGTT